MKGENRKFQMLSQGMQRREAANKKQSNIPADKGRKELGKHNTNAAPIIRPLNIQKPDRQIVIY